MAKDPLLEVQLPMIREIVRNETWYEGERRGQPVSASDPVVCRRVCEIVMQVGAELRARAGAELERRNRREAA